MLSGSLSANLYSVVKNTMTRTGTDATLVIPSGIQSYDPSTGTVTEADVTYPVRVIVMDFALISNGTLTDRGTLITSTDKQVFMDATQSDGSQPTQPILADGCKLVVGSTTYRITVVKQYNPTTTASIMFDLKVEL